MTLLPILRPLLRAVASPRGFPLVLGLLSLALHRDLLPRVGSAIPSDPGDPLLSTWILWWNAHTVPFTAAYWNAPAFAPGPYALALSETLLGLTWLTSPLQWLGASPLVAYNVLVLATPVLNGLSMYWLCLTLTGRREAAAVGGLAYAFAPYHASQLAHVQTQAMFWMPIALVGLHQYWATGRRRWLACLAAATALNGLTCGYFLLYFAVLLGLAIVWLAIASGTVRRLTEVAAALAVAGLALAPVIVTYRAVRAAWDLQRPFYEIESFGADLLLLAAGHERLVFWPIEHLDWDLPGRIYPQYPGVVIVLLVLTAAAVAWRRRAAWVGSRWRRYLAYALTGVAVAQLLAACVYWAVGPWTLLLGFTEVTVTRPWRLIGLALPVLPFGGGDCATLLGARADGFDTRVVRNRGCRLGAARAGPRGPHRRRACLELGAVCLAHGAAGVRCHPGAGALQRNHGPLPRGRRRVRRRDADADTGARPARVPRHRRTGRRRRRLDRGADRRAASADSCAAHGRPRRRAAAARPS